jgi:hypothetical protein
MPLLLDFEAGKDVAKVRGVYSLREYTAFSCPDTGECATCGTVAQT